jgi:hypothetical protein
MTEREYLEPHSIPLKPKQLEWGHPQAACSCDTLCPIVTINVLIKQ